MQIVVVVLVVLALLVLNEWWWRGKTHGEMSRKVVHIVVGTFVAFWPLLLSWRQIELLSIAFVIAVVVSKQFNVFRAIHTVERPTWGELYFGASVGLIALAAPHAAIYTVALLHMSLADGLAALVGQRYGRRSTYRIFGTQKSRIGTLAFLCVSLAILAAYSVQQDVNLGVWLAVIAGGATVLENVAIRGLDNLLVPLYVAMLLGLVG